MKVKLTLRAQQDFAAQIDWLKERSPSTGRRAAEAIVEALDLLRGFPKRGCPSMSNFEKHTSASDFTASS